MKKLNANLSLFLKGLVFIVPFSAVLISCSDGKGAYKSSVQTSRLEVNESSLREKNEVSASGEQGVSQVSEATMLATFTETVHTLAVEHCANCHAAAVSPYFADPNPINAYKAVSSGNKVDFVTPSNSRLVQRLSIEAHNCWNDCKANSAAMLEQINNWIAKAGITATSAAKYDIKTSEIAASSLFDGQAEREATPEAAPTTPPAAVPDAEVTVEAESLGLPKNWTAGKAATGRAAGQGEFQFITSALGENTFTAAEIGSKTDVAEFSVVLFVAEERNYTIYANASGSASNTTSQFFFKLNDAPAWTLANLENTDVFKFYALGNAPVLLTRGVHILKIRQKSANVRFDQFAAITRIATNGALTNFDGLKLVTIPRAPIFLSFDMSGPTGVPGAELVVTAEKYNDESYLFLSPVIIFNDASKAFRVQHIKPLINGAFAAQHTQWLSVDKVARSGTTLLSKTGMPVVADKGPAEDKISFAFERVDPVDPTAVLE